MKRINSVRKRLLRASLCDQADGRCAYCNRKIGMAGTVDHYLPQAMGGTNARENLRWCCSGCNSAKGDMHPDEWAERAPIPVKDAPARRLALLAACAPRGRRVA